MRAVSPLCAGHLIDLALTSSSGFARIDNFSNNASEAKFRRLIYVQNQVMGIRYITVAAYVIWFDCDCC